MAAATRPQQLRVGRLTKAHGLKGALKLELYTDDPERRFVPGAEFSLQVPADSPWHGRTLVFRELRWYNGQPVGFFEGIDDRTAAEGLVKAILWVDQPVDEEPEPDAWYDHQLIGLAVLRDGERIGEVAHVDHLPAQDLLVVTTKRGDVMVPFVAAFVPEVDVEAGTLTVTPPPGLFEELPEEPEVPAERGEAEASAADAAAGDDPAAASDETPAG
ncbi:ribosome maturation factor RimM [Agromyces sp. GXS1127]|uniref:ribosome maturation factor RimM n=1 Tax=Agromyces sp. GXS1127 TaxID=3424181 RepID=UPI003D31A933